MISIFEYNVLGFYEGISYRVHQISDVVVSNFTTDSPLLFQKAKINDISKPTNWIEGATEIELEEIEFAKIALLQKIVLDKIKRYSLALAMGKSINDDLEYFQEAYTTKYEMCKGTKSDPYNSILTESQLEGFSTKQEYVDLVISKFEQGLMFRDIALQMSEVLRKLILNDISALDYSKAIARLEIVNQLDSNITAGEVNGIFQQVLNL